MSKIILNGAEITPSTVPNHIQYRRWEIVDYGSAPCNSWDEEGQCNGWGSPPPIRGWVYYRTEASVEGQTRATVTNVLVEGAQPIVQGDRTQESDKYTIPSGEYYSGAHTNVQGTVAGGNSNNVYINGKLATVNDGQPINTHAGTSTNVKSGISDTVNIG